LHPNHSYKKTKEKLSFQLSENKDLNLSNYPQEKKEISPTPLVNKTMNLSLSLLEKKDHLSLSLPEKKDHLSLSLLEKKKPLHPLEKKKA